MSTVVQKLIQAGFTEQQAATLEDLYPEISRVASEAVNTAFLLTQYPQEVFEASGAATSCAHVGVDEILASFIIPEGVLSPFSVIQITPVWGYTNSANDKILKVKLNGITVYSATRTTSVREAPLIVIACRGSLQYQFLPYTSNYETASATAGATASIDLSETVTIDITGQLEVASETLRLDYYSISHFPGAQ